MPPTRTIPPVKAVKTERTHEENQERAYIAASRRSDRSLEARVESARRASEIHKRRTGRSLRVTEQDVINEEMYEEEDDDLPSQYRRLTAHLQTGHADFNRRLSAYITNQVAMRSALEHSMNPMYAQQTYSNMPPFAGQHSMFPSPMLAHQNQQQMFALQNPSMYRQAPYPTPRPQQQGFDPRLHQRSASIATPQDLSGPSQNSPVVNPDDARRMSMPIVPATTVTPVQVRTPISSSVTPQPKPSFPPGSFSSIPQPQNQYAPLTMGDFNNSYPFTTALPAESQGLLGSTLDFKDPLISLMMAGSNSLSQTYYDFNNQPLPQVTSIGKEAAQPTFDGLDMTLAPSAMENGQTGQEYSQEQDFFNDAIRGDSACVTPSGTEGVAGENWSSFINLDQWDAPSSQKS